MYCVSWNPDPTKCIIAASIEDHVLILTPDISSAAVMENSIAFLKLGSSLLKTNDSLVAWPEPTEEEKEKFIAFKLKHQAVSHMIKFYFI